VRVSELAEVTVRSVTLNGCHAARVSFSLRLPARIQMDDKLN
jgi:hypothetical protein